VRLIRKPLLVLFILPIRLLGLLLLVTKTSILLFLELFTKIFFIVIFFIYKSSLASNYINNNSNY
jgi:hypothetical protein